jgi:hypothetical protein
MRRPSADAESVTPGAESGPLPCVPEEAVCGPLHVDDVIDVRTDTTPRPEDRLHEHWTLDHPSVEEVGEGVQMRDVVGFAFESRRVSGPTTFSMNSMPAAPASAASIPCSTTASME